jgi:radical S-adenosyl methionine domain-containing protein 2
VAVFKASCVAIAGSTRAVIHAIASEPFLPNGKQRRLNFVGGEPTLSPYLEALVAETVACGLRASIVTNGFLFAKSAVLPNYVQQLEIVGISIDSLCEQTNLCCGRAVDGRTLTVDEYLILFAKLRHLGTQLKINTVVSAFNWRENMLDFILKVKPDLARWKVFQAIPVRGQNCDEVSKWTHGVTEEQFKVFIDEHQVAVPVIEPEEIIRGSYAMISPDGRFFDDTTGKHCYSQPILDVGAGTAWRQVSFSDDKYKARTAVYEAKTAEVA